MDKIKIKDEIVQKCLEFMSVEAGSWKWEELKDELINKYKFTPWNLLALHNDPPFIEYNEENIDLIKEKSNAKV